MSLGLRAGSRLHPFFGLFAPYGAGKLKELAEHARAYARRHRVEPAFRSSQTLNSWRLSFHPAAQDIELSLQGDHIVIDARTLEAGPGYHAFVVGFLDDLTQQRQWVWDLRKATRHFADDTGYYHDRDFAALQAAMAGEFAALCEGLCQAESGAGIPHTVWVRDGFWLASERFAATSLGFRDRAFFEAPSPERFFPWWEEGLTASTLDNMALSKMWLDLSWLPPETAAERADLENGLALADLAGAAGAGPASAGGAEDIRSLLRGEPPASGGGRERIGYARHDAWYLEPGGWSIALPAYFREDIGDNGQLCVLAYGDRAVYVRSYLYETEQADPEWPDRHSEGYGEYLRFETGLYRAVVETGTDEDEDGDPFHVWEATYNARTGSALISVVSRDPADAAWAETLLRSVQIPAS